MTDNPVLAEVLQAYSEGHMYIDFRENAPYCVREGSKLYLMRAYKVLQSIRKELERLKTAPRIAIDLDKVVLSESLQPEQKKAILYALQEPVATISGGPGTGKTFTAGHLIKAFLEAATETPSIVLCAPTGKAASNIAKSINRPLETKTLHALLQLRPFGKKNADFLPYDLVIVDESSMIDATLFERLLCRLSTGARLVLLGDPDQLPPIEPGAPFADLVDERGRLTKCLRTDLAELVAFAKAVKEGGADCAIELAKRSSCIDLRFMSEKELDVALKGKLPATLLSPLRHGKLGTDALNQMLYARHSHKSIPIIIVKNDYELGLTNGQIGELVGDIAYFEDRAIPRVLLGPFEPAFCLSVHKSQGSEFDEVLLLLPSGSERFGPKMLYTAITRTKKLLHIWTSEEIFRACIRSLA